MTTYYKKQYEPFLYFHKEELRACKQDTVYHAEGDVWFHTSMVITSLLQNPDFAKLPEERQDILLLTALYHDVAKPETRNEEYDHDLRRWRVTHHGHARRGAKIAWKELWLAGVPLRIRLQVYALILYHQKIFHLFGSERMMEDLAKISCDCRIDDLLMFAKADNDGRFAPNKIETQETLDLLAIQASELGCLDKPYPFESDEHKIECCRLNKPLLYAPYLVNPFSVYVMSGLPGAGKDTYIQKNKGTAEVISLDQIRMEMGRLPGDNHGSIIQEAMKRAKNNLANHREMYWNSTGITRQTRDKITDIILAYRETYIKVIAFDISYETIMKQNKNRSAEVPEIAIKNMIDKYEPPLYSEVHAIEWHSDNA